MDIIKNNFSQKYGGYLDDVSINLDPSAGGTGSLMLDVDGGDITVNDAVEAYILISE